MTYEPWQFRAVWRNEKNWGSLRGSWEVGKKVGRRKTVFFFKTIFFVFLLFLCFAWFLKGLGLGCFG